MSMENYKGYTIEIKAKSDDEWNRHIKHYRFYIYKEDKYITSTSSNSWFNSRGNALSAAKMYIDGLEITNK